MLLGNVLHWEVGYLGRQYPVLPAGPGFARKVKPLVKLGEREMAAYCVLRGIDYQVEECPMAEGNRHLGLKETLNQLESRSPGTKAAFLNGFWSRGHDAFVETADDERADLRPCVECGAPTPAERCAFCTLRARAARRAPTRRSSCGPADDRAPVTQGGGTSRGPFRAGEQVLLIDRKRRRHLIRLAEGGEFHTHAGVLDHARIIGQDEGATVRTNRNAAMIAVRPTLGEYVLEMPRGAQVIYPKDLGPILMLADIFPGARVLESGVGSGAMTMTLLRAVGPTGSVTGYELRDDFADRARRNVEGYLGTDLPLTIETRDVYEGIEVERPRPHRARPARSRGRW